MHLERHIDFRGAHRSGVVSLIDRMPLSIEGNGYENRLSRSAPKLPGQMMPYIRGRSRTGNGGGAPGGVGRVPGSPPGPTPDGAAGAGNEPLRSNRLGDIRPQRLRQLRGRGKKKQIVARDGGGGVSSC